MLTFTGKNGLDHLQGDEGSPGIDQEMALSADDLFPCVVAARLSSLGGANALAVENGRRGDRTSCVFDSVHGSQRFEHHLKKAVARPLMEMAVDGSPVGKIVGEHSPDTSRAQQVKNGVEDATQIRARSPQLFGW